VGKGAREVIRRTSKLLLEFLALVVAGITVIAVLVGFRLASGPVQLDFLTPHIEQALSAPDGSYRVRLDRTVLIWGGWERTIDLRARGVRMIGADGAERASVPELSLRLSLRAMIRGLFAPASLELIGPKFAIMQTEKGDFRLGAGRDAGDGGGIQDSTADMVEQLLGGLLKPPNPSDALGYLTSVSILGADMTFEDRRHGLSWRGLPVNVTLFRDDIGIGGVASLDLDVGGVKAHFNVTGEYDSEQGTIDLEARFADTELVHFAGKAPVLRPLSALHAPVSGTVGLTIGLDGRLHGLRFDFTAQKGTVSLPGLYAKPLGFRKIRALGRIGDNFSNVAMEKMDVDFGGPILSMTGGVSRKDGAFAVTADAKLNNLAIGDLARYWPVSLAPHGRSWVEANIDEGRIDEVRLAVEARGKGTDIAAYEIGKLAGTFQFSGLAVYYFRPLPPVRNLSGTARFTGERLDFTIAKGEHEGLSVDEGTVHLTGLDLEDQHLQVETVFRGPLRNALKVLDHPRLDYISGLGISPGMVDGKTAIRLVAQFPLFRDLRFDQVAIAAAANMRQVRLPRAFAGLDLSDGALTLQLDQSLMKVKGDVRLAGVPAKLAWTENFGQGAGFRRRYRVRMTADEQARVRTGFDFGARLRGPVAADLIFTEIDDKTSELSLALNLKRAAIALPEIGWSKAAGKDGLARLSISFSQGGMARVKDFTITAGDLKATGNAILSPSGREIKSIHFTRLVFAKNDISANLAAAPGGGYEIDIKGLVIDAEPYIGLDDDARGPPLKLVFDVKRLRLGAGRHLSAVSGTLIHDGEKSRSLILDARLGKGKRFRVRLKPEGKGRKLLIQSDDAGGTFRAFDIMENVVGGQLQVKATYDDSLPDRPLKGRVLVNEYRLTKAPVLAELLTVASVTGIPDLLSGPGIGFSRLVAPFTLTGDIVEFKEARTHGSALGFTADGKINLKRDELDLRGTIVPAYSVNAIIGNIPVLGTFLTGAKGGGVFAATYQMTGPLEAPKISVNPLAALTPGFLRNLFGIFEGGPRDPVDPEDVMEEIGND
jgi:hypothetical protein